MMEALITMNEKIAHIFSRQTFSDQKMNKMMENEDVTFFFRLTLI